MFSIDGIHPQLPGRNTKLFPLIFVRCIDNRQKLIVSSYFGSSLNPNTYCPILSPRLCWRFTIEFSLSTTMERQRAKSYIRTSFLASFEKFSPSSSSVNTYSRVSTKALKQQKLFKHSHKNSLPTKKQNFLNLFHRTRHSKMSTTALAPSSPKRIHSGGNDDLAAKKQKTGWCPSNHPIRVPDTSCSSHWT